MHRPPKRQDVTEVIADRVDQGRVRVTDHAKSKIRTEETTIAQVRQVMASGIHNHDQDEWSDKYNAWSYAIEGKTIDRRALRVAVAFAENDDALVVTVIELQELGTS